jgi:dTDP-4-amino-4,6-dideoxygalactose transaminase
MTLVPHYSTSFRATGMVADLLSARNVSVPELERRYAEALRAPEAVVIPSVRAAIRMLLQMVPIDLAVGPACTCLVVHEAMELSGTRPKYLDPSADAFLIPAPSLKAAMTPGGAVVLSEMYGLPYSDALLDEIEALKPRLRILDAAMGLPDPERTARLRPFDVMLFSFGFGKAMCAGGGGIAILHDRDLAVGLRRERERIKAHLTRGAQIRHNAGMLASVAMRTRLLAQPAQTIKAWRERRPAGASSGKAAPSMVHGATPEWTHSMTGFERRLAARNLLNIASSAALRRRQAQRYIELLGTTGLLPNFSGGMPQSHFPILVPADYRSQFRQHLRNRGFDTGNEFPFSGVLSRSAHPRAACISDRIVTLPLGEHISIDEVTRLCGAVSETIERMPSRRTA